ncbi:MAG TPA: hypothetical protein VJ813_04500 [Vicinamibacterales bacterium]|nr:hypothetical protein [Vicinamibacterales bacterium]
MKILLASLVALATLSSPAQAQNRGNTTGGSAAPADWSRTKDQIRELTFAGDDAKVIATVEPIVAKYPRFADGHARLGGAHESLARALVRTDRARATRHFEIAAKHLRQAFELGGGEYPDATIRALIDLYEYALPNPATWKATVLESIKRYPAEPAAHRYGVQLMIRESGMRDLDAAFGNARTALSSRKPRLEYASLLVGLAREYAETDLGAALAREALSLADEALKKYPNDRTVRREAEAIREDLKRLQ